MSAPPRRRYLVVAPQPFFTPRGTPFSVYYRTLVLAEQGAQIDLLTYGQGADVDLPSTRIVRIPDLKFLGHVPVGPSWKKLILDVFMVLWTIGLLARHRHAVVHAHEEAIFWCRFLRPFFRFKLVYDMHSSLPQQLSNFRFTKSRALIGLFKGLEDTCLRNADAVITICPDLRDYALSAGVDPARHFLIENSIFDDVSMRATRPREGGQPRTEALSAQDVLGLVDSARPIVLYAGTFEAYQGIEVLIRAFVEVQRARPDAQLLLVGGTAEQVQAMQKLAAELHVAAHFTGRVGKDVAMKCLAHAHVLMSPRLHGTNTPLKIYEQLASGKPLVATRIWSHTQVLSDLECVLVEPAPASMAAGILSLLESPALGKTLARAARDRYERDYARPIYEGKIRRLLERLA